MKDSEKEADRWKKQAENDLQFAQLALREGFYAQACFIAQQTGEKALKALAYRQGKRFVIGHSLLELIKDLGEAYPDLIHYQELAGQLDQYYIPTRYPNGLPAGAPYEVYNQRQAQEAVEGAQKLLEKIGKWLK